MYFPRATLALPPRSNSDPGSHSGPFSSPPHYGIIPLRFYGENNSAFSPRVELCCPEKICDLHVLNTWQKILWQTRRVSFNDVQCERVLYCTRLLLLGELFLVFSRAGRRVLAQFCCKQNLLYVVYSSLLLETWVRFYVVNENASFTS